MDKVDLFRELSEEYAVPRRPALLRTTKGKYLSIEGQGAPGSAAFTDSIGAMYAIAYTIKMTRKFGGSPDPDYKICPLETIYWADGDDPDFSSRPKDEWRWRMLIRTPDFVGARDLKAAQDKAKEKEVARAADVRLVTLSEGRCVQMLHVGPYDAVGPDICSMQQLASQEGYRFSGRYHEIYLSDPRRVSPEKLKTILRMPVTAVSSKS
jgi:hypothetical protein